MNTLTKTSLSPALASLPLRRQWLAFLAPVVLVLVGALGFFRAAVVASIASTPHPELVYAILAVFFIGVVLATVTLWRYTRETLLAQAWMAASAGGRQRILEQEVSNTYLQHLLRLFKLPRLVPPAVQQAMVDQEVAAIEARLEDRLTLPQYLAGALVGLGLVGTFVGLLGTLEDLGKLFGALANTDSSNTGNPADLFADMVRRLQEPMRGMGTAFVASLYGLLGSLVLGLQVLLVAKVGHQLSNLILNLVRQAAEEEASESFSRSRSAAVNAEVEAKHLAGQHDQFMKLVLATLSEQARLWRELGSELREQHNRSLQENQALRREVLTVAQSSQSLVEVVRQGVAAEERYRASVPRTSYWQDAWVKVQAYLQRSNTDQALAELLTTSRAQVHALDRVTASLINIEERLKKQTNLRLKEPAEPS